MWRSGLDCGLSVAGSLVCRRLTSRAMLRFHISLIGRVENWREHGRSRVPATLFGLSGGVVAEVIPILRCPDPLRS